VGTEGEERLPRSACDSLQQQPEAILQRANVEQDRRVGACARLSYDVLLEHIAQPSFGVDRYGVVNHWNRALERFCGIQAADAIGNPLATLLAPVLLERLAPALHAVQTPYSAERWDAPLILSGLLPIVRSENGPVTAQRILLLPRIYLPGCLDGFVALIEPTMDGPQQAG
jgi:PAS domain-containing protein